MPDALPEWHPEFRYRIGWPSDWTARYLVRHPLQARRGVRLYLLARLHDWLKDHGHV